MTGLLRAVDQAIQTAYGAILDQPAAQVARSLQRSDVREGRGAPLPNVADERLMEAMRHPARIRMEAWYDALQEHRRHPTFQVHSWAYTLEYGFTCGCSGVEQEWRIRVHDLHGMLPEAREAFQTALRRKGFGGNKKARQALRRADRKARALLHQFLTREQRWHLRAAKSFRVQGADGRTYLVTEGTANNVKVLENGEPRYSLCVVPVYKITSLPVYDLMLAQKVLLESNVDLFLRTAIVQDMVSGAVHKTGEFLITNEQPPPPPGKPARHPAPLDWHDVDHPRDWVVARLAETQNGEPHGDADHPDPQADRRHEHHGQGG